jgi:hypothetical protein
VFYASPEMQWDPLWGNINAEMKCKPPSLPPHFPRYHPLSSISVYKSAAAQCRVNQLGIRTKSWLHYLPLSLPQGQPQGHRAQNSVFQARRMSAQECASTTHHIALRAAVMISVS